MLRILTGARVQSITVNYEFSHRILVVHDEVAVAAANLTGASKNAERASPENVQTPESGCVLSGFLRISEPYELVKLRKMFELQRNYS